VNYEGKKRGPFYETPCILLYVYHISVRWHIGEILGLRRFYLLGELISGIMPHCRACITFSFLTYIHCVTLCRMVIWNTVMHQPRLTNFRSAKAASAKPRRTTAHYGKYLVTFVRQFHVCQFHAWSHGPSISSNSGPAFSVNIQYGSSSSSPRH